MSRKMKRILKGFARHASTTGGGALIIEGFMNSSMMRVAAGVILTLLGFGASMSKNAKEFVE
jgi:uncharacterized membrane protein